VLLPNNVDVHPVWFGQLFYEAQTNVTTTFQRAINATAIGGICRVPKGVFKIRGIRITKPMIFQGSGMTDRAKKGTTFESTITNKWKLYGGTCFVPDTLMDSAYLLRVSLPFEENSSTRVQAYEGDLNGVTVRDMSFADDRTEAVSGIEIYLAAHCTFENLKFWGLKRSAIHHNYLARESNYNNIIAIYCGTMTSIDSTTWGIFDFACTESGKDAGNYSNNFHFNNIVTPLPMGPVFLTGTTKDLIGPGRTGITGLSISNWYSHGLLAGIQNYGAGFDTTKAMVDSLSIMIVDNCYGLRMTNCKLSICGRYGYQMKVTGNTYAMISSSQFAGWYPGSGTRGLKSIYVGDTARIMISTSDFKDSDSGAVELQGQGVAYVDATNYLPLANRFTSTNSVRNAYHFPQGQFRSYAELGSTDEIFTMANNTARLFTMLGNGRLGLGTETPQYRLDVKQDTNAKVSVNCENVATTGNDVRAGFRVVTNTAGGSIDAYNSTYSDTAWQGKMVVNAAKNTRSLVALNEYSSGGFEIFTGGAAQANRRMQITSAGVTTFPGYVAQQGIYGAINIYDNSTAQSIPTGATYTKLTSFPSIGMSANVTCDTANDKITFVKTGKYRVTASLSFSDGTNNVEWRVAGFLNNVEQNQLHFIRKIGTSGDVGNAGVTGFVNVSSVPWDLDLRARHDNVGSVDLTVVYGNLNVEYVGE
jgi:hypothetical protein